MSTKIYKGVRFIVSSLEELHLNMCQWRARVAKFQKDMDASLLASKAVDIIDKAAWGGETNVMPLSEAKSWLDKRRDKVKNGQRDPLVDPEFTLVVLPNPTVSGMHLGMVYTEQRQWYEAFLSRPWVQDYAYWDNSDRPEHLSEDEWDTRRAHWEQVMVDPMHRPGQSGFTYECLPRHYDVTFDEIMAFADDFEARCRSIAHFQAEKDLYDREQKAGRLNWAGEGADLSKFMQDRDRALAWLSSSDGMEARAVIEDRAREKLPREITRRVLLGWGPSDKVAV